jgi:hypothetical protein
MTRRLAGLAAAAALQLVAVVLAHELVFLARYGSRYGEALAHTGHGQAWSDAVVSSLVLGAVVAGLAGARLYRLGVLVRRAGRPAPGSAGRAELRSLAGTFLRLGPRTAAINVAALTIQENLERAAIGAGPSGPGILLSPEYAGGIWITIGVGLLVGLVVALFAWRRRVLLARLRAARAAVPRRSRTHVLQPWRRELAPVASALGRKSALRAPPLPSAV